MSHSSRTLFVGQPIHDTMLDHAQHSPNVEVCGLLGGSMVGDTWHAKSCYPATNIAPDPASAYTIDPAQLVNVYYDLQNHGQQLIGIYHSHPHGPPHPSRTDLVKARYLDAAYVILYPGGNGSYKMTAWHIEDGYAHAIEIKRLSNHIHDEKCEI